MYKMLRTFLLDFYPFKYGYLNNSKFDNTYFLVDYGIRDEYKHLADEKIITWNLNRRVINIASTLNWNSLNFIYIR